MKPDLNEIEASFIPNAPQVIKDLVQYARELETRVDRLEFLALRAHHADDITEGQLVTALGIPRLDVRDRIKIMNTIMSPQAYNERSDRFEQGMDVTEMILEEYVTARDALKGNHEQ